ncbi:MAG: glycogen synthase [Clostridia bacterium]|nr:glycogen synthase [Clostridia bacterium]
MKILFAAGEAVPYSQAGGLGDVAGSLPKALAALGHEVWVFTPLYGSIKECYRQQMTRVCDFTVQLAWRQLYCGVYRLENGGVTYYFIDNEYYFKRNTPYGYDDDVERFAFFSKAVLAAQQQMELYADVVHANDWHTAAIPIYLRTIYRGTPKLGEQKVVFTIHNIGYQGQFGCERVGDVLGLDVMDVPLLEYDGCANLMKGAIVCSDMVSTVSPTYAREIGSPEFSCGLHHIINANRHKICGIVNGIDVQGYNPATDPALAANYSADDLSGKALDKVALLKIMGMDTDPDLPLFVMVTRLVDHKGMDIVARAMHRIMAQNCRVAVLGSGDPHYERFLNEMRATYAGRFGVYIGFSPELARKVYAGGDFFLMPSRYEPCGLAQMIAMRYGTVPIVRQTGGLADTVHDCRLGEGNGIVFAGYSPDELMNSVNEALRIYSDREDFEALRAYVASEDFSWTRSAKEYEQMYVALFN